MKALALLFFAQSLFFAAYAQEFRIAELDVSCVGSPRCQGVEESLNYLKQNFTDELHFKNTLKSILSPEGVSSFRYQLISDNEQIKMQGELKLNSELASFEIKINSDMSVELPALLPLREGDYLRESKIRQVEETLEEYISAQGFSDVNFRWNSKDIGEGVEVELEIDAIDAITIAEVEVVSDSQFLGNIGKKFMAGHVGDKLNLSVIKASIDELRQTFLGYGYYLNEINLSYDVKGSHAKILIEISNRDLYAFHIKNNDHFTTYELKGYLKSAILSYRRSLTAEAIVQRLEELYAQQGFLDAIFSVRLDRYENIAGDYLNVYEIDVNEKLRTRIQSLDFSGNAELSDEEVEKFFRKDASDVVKAGYYQQEYIDQFAQILRKHYIGKGYVAAQVDSARVRIENGVAYVNYRVREGLKAEIRKINFRGASLDLSNQLKEQISNKEKAPFNPLTLKQDLDNVEIYLQNQGYYFAQIAEKEKGIVEYTRDSSEVDIEVELSAGEKITVNRILIVGNRKTKSMLIRRYLEFEQGKYLTRDSVGMTQTNLLSLNIFSNVTIEPIPISSKLVDIVITVKEKDFGLLEVAPGIRTDLGPKLSLNLDYNNLEGMNKRVSFRGQVNQRINLYSLDKRRRRESNSLVEYDLATNYSENQIFGTKVNFNAGLSFFRRRFFAFDADISRINYTLTRAITSRFSVSMRQQYENIEQFDATYEREEGTFRIGSLTPTVTWDLRNNRINPTSGGWFNLSMEVANPALLSQDTEDLRVDYYKVISRNRFYIPYDRGALAMSFVMGMQENLAKGRGYIPNIKAFRLNGIDIVRGFEDSEINTLTSQQDISQVRIDDKAYMAVMKIEPRYFLSDSTILGVFYDAGRVFVNDYDLEELRSSVGVSFKYLTPVGSLDFDYGIKLLRKRGESGSLESPGRLHVSIGFF